MSKFVINGGRPLSGEIRVSGSKNAVLPLMAACLLTDQKCVLRNVPRIADVEAMTAIIADLGAEVEYKDHEVVIWAKNVTNHCPNPALVAKLRASILLLGSLLARIKKVEIPYPGGDRIGVRPINTHVKALNALGASFHTDDGLVFFAEELRGNKIVLEESSVTATENAMMAAATAAGTTIIKLAAMEPHVQQLAEFLNKMGARITGAGTTTITIEGVEKLTGAEISVIPDSEEAASLITLAAATKSDVRITGLNPNCLDDFLLKIKAMGVNLEVGDEYVRVKISSKPYKAHPKLQSGLYPKLNSDFLPPMAVLATQAEGETFIYEWMYENRLGYVAELAKMGASVEVLDPHRVKIKGPTSLHGQRIATFDLRMGITLVIAGLVADGQTELDNIEHIDRGYEGLEERLVKLGADIKRVEN
ncbi:MAG: UDP-N-acetylglucosamine 1-carboxyvinyltransferase [Candidatus Doudnabacteria bacterium]|nr:UDP-N-acetylglucosamine 1-carboxyvinyltransferase [Candidatus Doudnabacteria bacterium]